MRFHWWGLGPDRMHRYLTLGSKSTPPLLTIIVLDNLEPTLMSGNNDHATKVYILFNSIIMRNGNSHIGTSCVVEQKWWNYLAWGLVHVIT
jgi:hypothetical protein